MHPVIIKYESNLLQNRRNLWIFSQNLQCYLKRHYHCCYFTVYLWPSVGFRPLHTLSLSTVSLGSICCLVHLVRLYENLTCSISTRLNSPGKTWKVDISGAGRSWKTHIKRSWKVMENHFECSACTLLLSNTNPIFCRIVEICGFLVRIYSVILNVITAAALPFHCGLLRIYIERKETAQRTTDLESSRPESHGIKNTKFLCS